VTWRGSTPFSSGTLTGYVDWAVFAPGVAPTGGFDGYAPTSGEGTYVFQVFTTGAAPLSNFKVGIIPGAPVDNIGSFSTVSINGDAPTSLSFSGSPQFDTASWNFAGITTGNSSRGLVFSSIKLPVAYFGSVIDTGQSAFVIPLPTPNGTAGGPEFPEPSTFVLSGLGLGVLLVQRLWKRRKVQFTT